MKYLFIKSTNYKENRIVPVDAQLTITWMHGIPYLTVGDKALIDVDKRNESELIPFLAEAFTRSDCVTIQLTGNVATATT